MTTTREQVKRLWQTCFDDSEAFRELYFRLRYNEEVNLAIRQDGEVVAALQMLPYPMTFGPTVVETAYVSGACTHPDCRNRGVMRRLLGQAFERMRQKGVVVSTLIPAEPWLFGYYARVGYAPVFRRNEARVTVTGTTGKEADTPTPAAGDDGEPYALDLSATDHAAAQRYLQHKLSELPCSVLHTEADFRVVMEDLALSGGHLCLLRRAGEIRALAVLYPAAGETPWRAEELLADTPEERHLLLTLIGRELETTALLIRTTDTPAAAPFGMARIVHAPELLQHYAAAHPTHSLSLHLTDEQLPANSGYYRLHDGLCSRSDAPLADHVLSLSIGQLADRLFTPLHPHLSLMMD